MMPADPPIPAAQRPVLVYDGDCGFCRYWVDYWQQLTVGAVEYRPFEEVAAQFPAVPRDTFARTIVLFRPDGVSAQGAAAALQLLAMVPGHGGGWWCYRRIPGFARSAELAYRVIAAHRVAAARISRALWGTRLFPATHSRVAASFLTLLGLIYLAAFASFGSQAPGLIGSDGITPLTRFLAGAREALGPRAVRELPMVFWWGAGDAAIRAVCALGIAAALGIIAGLAQRFWLAVAYGLYLSLFHAGQQFMGFQWDLLLLEVGFLAIFLPGGSPRVIWLFRWLTFRFLFLAGLPKLQSGDPTWWNLEALRYHFETQPLPTPLAWQAHALPDALHTAGTLATLLLELVFVFLIFLPRRLRHGFAAMVLVFQGLIVLTGNFNFFNLLTMALCLTLFDDAALGQAPPATPRAAAAVRPRTLRQRVAQVAAVAYVGLGMTQIYEQASRRTAWTPLSLAYHATGPWQIVNGYGLFAHMTTSRPEIVIEGSVDRRRWYEYRFRYKPDTVTDAPGWNIPHQPRLDWQMWFAALGSAGDQPWFGNLMWRLLQGSPPVLALFEHNPFPAAPPRYVRAVLYEFRFAPGPGWGERHPWWQRRPIGLYFPEVTLRGLENRP